MRDGIKQKVLQYTDLTKEMRIIQERLKDLRNPDCNMLHDVVTGSSSGFPWTKHVMHVEGIDAAKVSEKIKQEEKRYVRKLNKIISMKDAIEEYIDSIEDCRTRTIFELHVLKGKNFEEIGEMLNFHRTTCIKIFNNYLKEQ